MIDFLNELISGPSGDSVLFGIAIAVFLIMWLPGIFIAIKVISIAVAAQKAAKKEAMGGSNTVEIIQQGKKASVMRFNVGGVSMTPKASKSGKVHGGEYTHDRLDTDCYDVGETKNEHYLKQIDSLRKAGMMSDKEYYSAMKKYSN